MKVTVTRATKDDAVIIALLGRVTFDETFGHLFSDRQDLTDYFDRTFSVKKIQQGLEKQDNVFWLAYYGNLPVGYLKLKISSPNPFLGSNEHPAQLQKIYVLKDFLSKKVGRHLMDAMYEELKRTASGHLWLSVLNTNERAIGFYKKGGFSVLGEHTFSIGKENFDFIYLGKKL